MKKNLKIAETIRLNKYISNSGLCSRREADQYIELGAVKVNGKVVTQMGYQVKLNEEVRCDDRRINPEKPVYLLLNKPKGYLAAPKKGVYKKDVFDLIRGSGSVKLESMGPMDRTSMGLLLFTNDLEMKEKLRNSPHGIKKIIQVVLDKNISKTHIEKIKAGVYIDKENKISVEDISHIIGESKRKIGIEIRSRHVLYKIVS